MLKTYHRFLDEAGDTTFYGKGKQVILGSEGVSKSFIIGLVKFKSNIETIREQIIVLQHEIENDSYYYDVPSVHKRIAKNGFFFHAKDDIPEIREKFFRYIHAQNCSCEAIVGRKIIQLFQEKHKSNEAFFYADLISHLLKNKLKNLDKLVLNVASRGKCTKNQNLEIALQKAIQRFRKKSPDSTLKTKIVFNVQTPLSEPLLCVADYFMWSIQRVFEKGDVRSYNYLSDKISTVIDIYDVENYTNWGNYYGKKNKLTSQNKISP